jgi:hypothetical protein
MVKATYSLDVETVRKLKEIASQWGVSKSEALRRAIRWAAAEPSATGKEAIHALDALQRSLALDSGRVGAWAATAAKERKDASTRREGRRR